MGVVVGGRFLGGQRQPCHLLSRAAPFLVLLEEAVMNKNIDKMTLSEVVAGPEAGDGVGAGPAA